MKEYIEKVTFIRKEYKTTSYYGNPSYYVYFIDANNNYACGYTGSNCACGYSVSNYNEGDKIVIKYHFTKNRQFDYYIN